jgi:hypothetical protein
LRVVERREAHLSRRQRVVGDLEGNRLLFGVEVVLVENWRRPSQPLVDEQLARIAALDEDCLA